MFQTKLSIQTPKGPQSVQAARYTFPIPSNIKITPSILSYTGLTSLGVESKYIDYDIQDVNSVLKLKSLTHQKFLKFLHPNLSESVSSSCVSKFSYRHDKHSYIVTNKDIVPQTNIEFEGECTALFEHDVTNFITSPFNMQI